MRGGRKTALAAGLMIGSRACRPRDFQHAMGIGATDPQSTKAKVDRKRPFNQSGSLEARRSKWPCLPSLSYQTSQGSLILLAQLLSHHIGIVPLRRPCGKAGKAGENPAESPAQSQLRGSSGVRGSWGRRGVLGWPSQPCFCRVTMRPDGDVLGGQNPKLWAECAESGIRKALFMEITRHRAWEKTLSPVPRRCTVAHQR